MEESFKIIYRLIQNNSISCDEAYQLIKDKLKENEPKKINIDDYKVR